MKTVHIIGVPLDLGGGRRGVDMGPSALRIAGLGERISDYFAASRQWELDAWRDSVSHSRLVRRSPRDRRRDSASGRRQHSELPEEMAGIH